RALVKARWDDAVARGTPLLVTHAGALSRPILGRLGFSRSGRDPHPPRRAPLKPSAGQPIVFPVTTPVSNFGGARVRMLVERLPLVAYVDRIDDVSSLYISPQIVDLIGCEASKLVADPDLRAVL